MSDSHSPSSQPGPVSSSADAYARYLAFVAAGRPSHQFAGGQDDIVCRDCSDVRSAPQHQGA